MRQRMFLFKFKMGTYSFGNPTIVAIIQFEETMFNNPVGGCWDFTLDPMMFEICHSWATDIPKFPLTHS